MAIKYRNAVKDESEKIAEMVSIASHGMVEFLYHDLVLTQTPVQIVADFIENDNEYNYKNTIVAECNNEIVGMVLSLHEKYFEISPEMEKFIPEERLNHIREIFKASVKDSLLIDSLCVAEKFQKQGIATHLIALTIEKAKNENFKSLSLLVAADNTNAFNLYKKIGFSVVKKVKIIPHELFNNTDAYFLMELPIIK